LEPIQAKAAYDVIVLGAGAAGLMCALTAAGRGRSVLLLEKANKPGKKILMSGGGRCNFTNLYVEPENFICANPHFCKSALSRYTQWDFIAMVERHGIEYEERSHGQLFCVHSAKEILSMLLQECRDFNVELRTRCDIQAVSRQDSSGNAGYTVSLRDEHTSTRINCHSLVVATGALSIPTLGGSGMGYDLATQFKLPLLPRRAGLVPFMFSDTTRELCERLAGVSVEAEVRCGRQSFTEKVLFTHRGISGPAILQISSYWQPGDAIELNLLPGTEATGLLLDAKRAKGSNRLSSILTKALPRALVTQLQALWWPQQNESTLADFSDAQLTSIGAHLNSWVLKPSATEGYRTAEVTLGGVDTDAISSKTMEARDYPGLYFIGEVVDVTGHLGGFNFQWAWSSGYTAGLFA
jgi:predicted Rossmann fold flavoprotein